VIYRIIAMVNSTARIATPIASGQKFELWCTVLHRAVLSHAQTVPAGPRSNIAALG
jgi:hypothetical protein